MMEYKVLVDSCVDMNDQVFCAGSEVERVPFTVTIDGEELVDRGSSVPDRLSAIRFMARTIRTACPAPGDFIEALDGATRAFIITISSQLSGSYASAMVACDQLRQEFGSACDLHVVDSESACCGESLVALKVMSLLRENLTASSIMEKMNQYVQGLKTFFVLESMDTLVANGRVRAVEGFAIKALKICPIMGEDGHGKIELKGMTRGRKRAFQRLIEMIGEGKHDFRDRILGITHVNAQELAQELKRSIEEKYSFKEVLIFQASGLSSVYASNGGIVVAY